MKKKKSKFKSKPSYNLYIALRHTIDTYLMSRIDAYIFFQYYEWIIPAVNSNELDNVNLKDINILKNMLEYEYQIFKVLLFLYWDLEYYLESIDYVKNCFKIDSVSNFLFKIKNKNNIKDLELHIKKLKMKRSSYFWTDLELYDLLDQILKYDLYLQYYHFNTKYIDATYLVNYNLYKNFNAKINAKEIDSLRVRFYVFVNDKKKNKFIVLCILYRRLIQRMIFRD
jgi:hypothetical protein